MYKDYCYIAPTDIIYLLIYNGSYIKETSPKEEAEPCKIE